ncbi:MAG TPA: TolC family protein [Chitinophagaceae bacterium]|jgi:outer membrane protein TolC|nr:TolC family protein [Chitinophagaceae bacterium]
MINIITNIKRGPAFLLCVFLAGTFGNPLQAQQAAGDSLLQQATLENIIQYALKHQPVVQQSLIDEQITDLSIKNKLADWYPQLNLNYNLQHNFKVQTAIIGGNPIKLGVDNTSAVQFSLSQKIFDRDVLLASRTATDVRTAARQNTTASRIDIAAGTAKAFYDVLTTRQQIHVADEDIVRLERSLKDATSRYQAGITDKTDYKRATIALNNAKALRQSQQELLKAKLEYLKTLIGYPSSATLDIQYDSLQMEREAITDTIQSIDYNQRIEYKILETQKKLLQENLRYNKWAFLPSLSLQGAYNLNFQNNEFAKLYNANYPNSFAALTLSLPIFQGGKRKFSIAQSEWELKRLDWGMVNLKNAISAEYAQALASYKSQLAVYQAIKENLDLAQEVYDVIRLQYQSGIKAYLEVINAETDLRTAKINYYNTLFQVLSSKIDLEKALGQINY